MKLRLCLFLAAISFVLAIVPAETARRPRYGGKLRAEIGAVVSTLDPAVRAANFEEAAAKNEIDALIYEARNPDGTFAGTAGSGAFRLAAWEPGRRLLLTANDDYRSGQPFVDSIEIRMGREARDRVQDLATDKIDFGQIPTEQASLAAERGVRVNLSQPDELLAMVFIKSRTDAEDARGREAIARSIDRQAIADFILQKRGDAAGSLLPQWSSGTAFLFSTSTDLARAKELAAQIAPSPKIALGYDSGDALERSVAERIVVNAKDAGISVTATAFPSAAVSAKSSASVDARLVRMRMPSPMPRLALMSFLSVFGRLANVDATPLPDPASPEDIYNRERTVVDSYRLVPLVWLPQAYGLSARVRDWKAPGPGETWPLGDVWLDGPAEPANEKANQ
jgi:ABC-type transport system substrate-binding protein